MAEIGRTELWVAQAGHELNGEFPVPTDEALQIAWSDYLGHEEDVVAAPGVYGVVGLPAKPPRAYASIDLCEVLRQTGMALRSVEEQPPKSVKEIECAHHYGEGLSIVNYTSVIQVLMNHDLVPPIEDIEEVVDIIREWRESGVYTAANTSTLPGCELATVRFLGRYATGAFGGILFPRNHDGKSTLTKGVAARNVLHEFGGDDPATVVHIDDVTHHNINFRAAMQGPSGAQVATFQPRYPSCFPVDEGSVQTETPLEAFRQADEFLRQALGS